MKRSKYCNLKQDCTILTDLSELLIVFSFAYFVFWSGGYKNAKQQIKSHECGITKATGCDIMAESWKLGEILPIR